MTAHQLPQFEGIDILALAEEHGTPLYVYDGDRMKKQVRRLQSAFGAFPHRIQYACKANNNLAVMALMRAAGTGLDAVSIQEVELGLRAGYSAAEILFTPNCVPFEEIARAVELGVILNIDNIAVLEQFGANYGGRVPVCIRINPHILGGGNGHIQTGHIDSKFGISIFQLRHILRVVKAYGMHVKGLHMHTGSDILDADVFLQAADVLFSAALEFDGLESLDFGSGFKVAYRNDDTVTDVEALGTRIAERLDGFTREYGRQVEVWFEPGKFLVSEAGLLLVRCSTVKQTVSTVFVGVDSGQNHLLRPKLYDAYHRIVNLSNPDGVERVYSVVGYICETDTFAWDRKLAEVRVGDVLALANAGAYGYAMSSNYNARPRPAEVLTLDGEAHLIRRRETVDDLLRAQEPVPAAVLGQPVAA
jgi:diaminopimelate decarboxylase